MGPAEIGVLIPIAAIVGGIGYAALRQHMRHRERMEELRQQNLSRSAEVDRQLPGTDLQAAHLEAIPERLSSIEQRLDRMDGARGVSTATTLPTPIAPTTTPVTDRREREIERG